ncbi:MAG: 3-oxoacyl-ACP synthase III [Pirellulaceae bacterium]|nr:3-oxoacyl-ACP synthase III [Pirellulaceae bacterium]
MKFNRVAIASVGYVLPSEVLTSEQLENRLDPLYHRLKLPVGRLELMSGIRERRLWPLKTRIAEPSIRSGRLAMTAAGIDPKSIGCLIHASVCRDYLEPATACGVHHALGLPNDAWVYDVSNACLGIMNATMQIAMMIEAGVIHAGIAVGTENARGLIEATIAQLNGDQSLTRQSIKSAFASLTIGSGSCAWLLVDRERFGASGALHSIVAHANTAEYALCQSDTDQAGDSMQPIMNTDSEKLLEMGIATGAAAFEKLERELPWPKSEIRATVCHQVGATHRRLMLDRIGLPIDRDFATFEYLGNTGSVALPTALGEGLFSNQIADPSRTVLMGIGSGINSVMIAADLTGTIAARESALAS